MRLYHFTNLFHLAHIEAAGFIATTESNGSMAVPHAMPDVVWLMEDGSPTGGNGLIHPNPEFNVGQYDKTRVRIAVDIPAYRAERWVDWAARHRVDDLTLAVLVETGGGPEAASGWWVCERRIDRRFWSEITDMQTGDRLDIPENEKRALAGDR